MVLCRALLYFEFYALRAEFSMSTARVLTLTRTLFFFFVLKQVIPRKDLPRIYTMCLPVKDRDGGFYAKDDLGEGDLSLSTGLQDLEVRAIISTEPAPRLGVGSSADTSKWMILVRALLVKPLPAPYQDCMSRITFMVSCCTGRGTGAIFVQSYRG